MLTREYQLGQNRLIPEYSFLDARALGKYEGKPAISSLEEVHHQDEIFGIGYKPESGSDETPSESITQVLARDNQLISTIESMYSGENVLIISPDSDVLSILTAALYSNDPDTDIPKHARFAFANGEFRPLTPYVKPFIERSMNEQDAETRQMRSLRMKANQKPSIDRVESSWFDLWLQSDRER